MSSSSREGFDGKQVASRANHSAVSATLRRCDSAPLDDRMMHKLKVIIEKLKLREAGEELIEVLLAAKVLLKRPENDFAWSPWESADDAIREIDDIVARIKNGDTPEQFDVSVLFAPTGPIQEVSLSSGWADEFLPLAGRFDAVERRLWRH